MISRFLERYFPGIRYFLLYKRAARKMGDKSGERTRLFRELVEQGNTKKCLQIGVRNQKYAPHWISVDRFDMSPLIDFHYDIHDLKFDDESFDIIVCNAILEHVENPQKAISELFRVLKKEGRVWIEVPFNQPYHPSPNDYWRVSPEGVKIWMKDFRELASGFFKINKSALYNGIFFYGYKP
ncbi:class I SAM-dependent methyltransferase [Candidatus Sumerlaeota bacterium]|nr:class I SAM-dependent methyltransferase [Candidatus Sumerlaeota bacterium]